MLDNTIMMEEDAPMNDTAKSLVDGYRALADFIEAHADDLMWPTGEQSLSLYGESDNPENVSRVTRLLTPVTKRFSDTLLYVTRSFSDTIQLSVVFCRSAVCTKRVVGTKHIKRQVIEAHDEEIVEWDCEPLLGGTEAELVERETL